LVTATSNADPTKSASATVTITPPSSSAPLAATPSSVNFGSVVVGTKNTQTITLANSGTGSLTISQAAVSGSGFTTSGLALPLTLNPGQGSNFTLAFAPAAAGSVTGSVSLISNAPNSPTSIAFSGTGLPATMQLTADPTSVSFGNVNLGSSSSKTVTLSNTGNASVNVSSDSVSGAGFSISGLTPLTLAAGQSTTFGVKFAPTAAGSVSGSVLVSSNATNSPAMITLSGSGISTPPPPPTGPLAAFPGAQGGGALSVGGRGGVVMEVTNLNDSGSGSLRACVEGSGPRTCVFRVGGTIRLQSSLHILNPYITIAGQTAPGGGIQVTNSPTCNVSANCDLIRIGTHDVIVRYLRARLSANSGTNYSSNVSILNEPAPVYNVMVDHVSTAWAQWDNFDFYQGWDTTPQHNFYNISVQWAILAEPNYATNGQVNFPIGGTEATCDIDTDIDLHHNFFTGGNHRNPNHAVKSGRIINNIIYNTSYYDIKLKGDKDVIGNYIKKGPYWSGAGPSEIQTWTAAGGTTTLPNLYIAGNAANSNNFNPNADQWSGTLTGVAPTVDNSDNISSPIPTTYRRTTPLAAQGQPITVDAALDLAVASGKMLTTVGASEKLSDTACDGTFVSNRDSTDARLVREFNTGGGISSNLSAPVEPPPSLAAGTPCASSLHDGIADQWKVKYGLSTTDGNLYKAIAPNGYTYLENYLNGADPNLTARTNSATSIWAALSSKRTLGGGLNIGLPALSKATTTIQRREIFLSPSTDLQRPYALSAGKS
jgi:Abnormal spindle-like microcephaly-assoc'd, ASPM-SPD-2-Hydin